MYKKVGLHSSRVIYDKSIISRSTCIVSKLWIDLHSSRCWGTRLVYLYIVSKCINRSIYMSLSLSLYIYIYIYIYIHMIIIIIRGSLRACRGKIMHSAHQKSAPRKSSRIFGGILRWTFGGMLQWMSTCASSGVQYFALSFKGNWGGPKEGGLNIGRHEGLNM